MPAKRNIEEIKEIVENLGYELIDEYMEKNYRRVIIKDSDGYKYDVDLNGLVRGKNPDFVSISNPFALENNIPLWLEINNKSFSLKEDNVYLGNKEKLFFSCDVCSEEFDSIWSDVSQGHGCPYCSGRRVSNKNRLSLHYPEIVSEWHPTKNGNLTPDDVSYGSDKKVWWLCDEGHEWEASTYSRTNMKSGCPYCSGRFATDKNRLSLLYPDIASEWHPTKNGDLTPYDVSYGSNIKAWWICKEGHQWNAIVVNRINGGSGCPKCASSKGEKEISSFLKEFNIEHDPEYKFEDCRYKRPLPFDFAVFDSDGYLHSIIEYHGRQHFMPVDFFGGEKAFRLQKIKDKIKQKYCEDNNIPLKIIPYWDFDNIESILQNYLFENKG